MDLASNAFTGTLPSAWGSLGSWPELTFLSLAGNNVSGQPALCAKEHIYAEVHLRTNKVHVQSFIISITRMYLLSGADLSVVPVEAASGKSA